MNDPHVVTLTYKLMTEGGLAFGNPQAVDYSDNGFKVHLEEGTARVGMQDHYASEADARAVVEPFLRAWEVAATLEFLDGTMSFEFVDAEIIDRKPPPPGSVSVVVGTARLHLRGLQAHVSAFVSRNKYPDVIPAFVVTPDVETLVARYNLYRQHREPIASMAYACLTFVEMRLRTKHRKQLGQKLGFEESVLRKLGHLTSTLGDGLTARKFDPKRPPTGPFSPAEIDWIDATIRLLIRRIGELAYDPNVVKSVIRMKDLPPL